jgi:aminoglycoside phosphotransferase
MRGISTTARDEAGIAWAAQILNGKLIGRRLQERWRTQWILEFDTGAPVPTRVLLRGFRNPGYCDPDDRGARDRLEQEAGVLEALQDQPLRVPRYYGHNKELGWTLMEFVAGEAELTQVADSDRRFKIYTGYMEELAKLHALPLRTLRLPKSMHRPASCNAFRQHLIDTHIPIYRAFKLKRAEPTMELGIQWTVNNPLKDERPICLGFGDVGPNQFLFKDDAFTSFIDIEYAVVGDPLQEIGQMRSRDVTYHSGRMTEHIRHYGTCYEKLTRIPLSLDSLQFWTIAGPSLWNVFTVRGTQDADPRMIDLPFAMAYEIQQKRCILEGIAEKYGLQLSSPELPLPRATMLGPYHSALVGQLEQHYLPRATSTTDQAFLRYTAALAKTLARGNACQTQMEGDNLEEVTELLGYRPQDFADGLHALQEQIARDHMRDLERRLNFLYRMEVRRDYLYEPMQLATGVSASRPMSRFDCAD